jgi:hypothetical protein
MVFSLGNNGDGKSGLGVTTGDTLIPTPINTSNLAGRKIAQVAYRDSHALLLADDGTVFSFGWNADGRTGLGFAENTGTPVATPIDTTNYFGAPIVGLAAGSRYGLILDRADGPRVALISSGDSWSYLDNGSNQGTAWRNVGFNDDAWPSGPSQLGFGDGDEQTIIECGPGPAGSCSPANGLSNNFATTYFRITGEFDSEEIASLSSLFARIRRDDGAVVYVNGVEVYRDASLRPGAAFNEFANYNGAAAVGGADESAWRTFSFSPSLLRDGENVIAVEVHQQAGSSSDLSFDFELVAAVTPIPEPTSLALAIVGLGSVAVAAKRKRRR